MGKINSINIPTFHVDLSRNTLCIGGYDGHIIENCFLMSAFGSRYHDYGIADNSLLLCSPDAPLADMDLVIAEENGGPAVFVFSKDRSYSSAGRKRILHDKSRIQAKILGAFNFYQ